MKEETYNRLIKAIQTIFKNKKIMIGLGVIIFFLLLTYLAPFLIPFDPVTFGRFPPDLPPSSDHPFGTDSLGRDVLGLLSYSVGTSLLLGLMAGTVATLIAVTIGFIAAFQGGVVDDILRSVIDVFLVIPLWPVLVVVSCYVRNISISLMATLLAIFSWPAAARALRSQVLSLKERGFVDLAKLSGLGSIKIIFIEVFPNMIPYVGVGFITSTTGAMMSEVALEILGIGPQRVSTIGIMLYWAMSYAGMVRGLWWWITPPIVSLIIIFISLFIVHVGMDEISNPRLRR